MANNTEHNNNVDEIQPQFMNLPLYSPTSQSNTRKSIKTDNALPVKCLRLYVEATCALTPSRKHEIINLSCKPITESSQATEVPTRDSVSLGQVADVSKSSNSGTSFPSCAAASVYQQVTTDSSYSFNKLTVRRINQLNKKWKNSTFIYRILDWIDRAFVEEGATSVDVPTANAEKHKKSSKNLDDEQEKNTTVHSSNKRHLSSPDTDDPVSKRLSSGSPLACTPGEDLLGIGVFAKWQNRKYYFAHVVDMLLDGRLQVLFLDTSIQTVTRDQIISEMELVVGHKVKVAPESDIDNYYPGIVTALFSEKGIAKYSFATNKGDFDVPFGQVYFRESQATLMKKGLRSVSVSLVDMSGGSGFNAGCSGIHQHADNLSETDVSPTKPSLELDLSVTGCDVETNDPQNLNASVKLKNVQGKPPKKTNKNEDCLLGPLKMKGTWFTGTYFVITCSTHITPSISEGHPFSAVPYVYDRLVQQITLAGGKVFDKFDDVSPNQYRDTYLVTNRPCLTPKYLKCLAAGIQIICHEWIVNCTIKQKRLPLHELPAGWSLEKCRFVNSFERKSPQPLSGLRVKVAQLTDKNFYTFWSDICFMVGGSASKFTGTFENTDVIVVEHGLKDPKLDIAIAYGIPIVSAAWVIQSVIHGEVRPYDGHSSYNHLFEETEEF